MKKLITLTMLLVSTVMCLADLFIAIPADADKAELDAINKLIRTKIDPDYDILTMGVKLEKDKVVYLCCNYDVDGRGFKWNVATAKADIVKEEAKTPTLTNVVVDVKRDDKFKPEEKAIEKK